MKSQYIYSGNKLELLDVLKWLRRNGTRGVDWDFSGGSKLFIKFTNDQLEVAYILRWLDT